MSLRRAVSYSYGWLFMNTTSSIPIFIFFLYFGINHIFVGFYLAHIYNKDGCMFKDCCWVILITLNYNDIVYQVLYLHLVDWYYSVIYDVTLTLVIWVYFIILWADYTQFSCIYMCLYFWSWKICMNDYFCSNSFFYKMKLFCCFVALRKRQTVEIIKSNH